MDAAADGPDSSAAGGFETTVPAGALVAAGAAGTCAFRFAEQIKATNAKTKTDLMNSFTSKLLISTPMPYQHGSKGCQGTESLPYREKFHKQIFKKFWVFRTPVLLSRSIGKMVRWQGQRSALSAPRLAAQRTWSDVPMKKIPRALRAVTPQRAVPAISTFQRPKSTAASDNPAYRKLRAGVQPRLPQSRRPLRPRARTHQPGSF